MTEGRSKHYIVANPCWGRVGSQLMEEFSARLIAEAYGYKYLYKGFQTLGDAFLEPAGKFWPRLNLERGELLYSDHLHLPHFTPPCQQWPYWIYLEGWQAELEAHPDPTIMVLPVGLLPFSIRWSCSRNQPRYEISAVFDRVRQQMRDKAGLNPPEPQHGPVRSIAFYVRGWAEGVPDFDVEYAKNNLLPDFYNRVYDWLKVNRGFESDTHVTVYTQGPESIRDLIPCDTLVITPESDTDALWAAAWDMVMCDACALGHGQFGNLISIYRKGLMFSSLPRNSTVPTILL